MRITEKIDLDLGELGVHEVTVVADAQIGMTGSMAVVIKAVYLVTDPSDEWADLYSLVPQVKLEALKTRLWSSFFINRTRGREASGEVG